MHCDIDVGAATLDCVVDGTGPLVICAHGFPDCARSFRHQVQPLVAAGFGVVRPSMRGYAPSSVASDAHYDAATLGADLLAVADALSPGQRVYLVGHDWGAIAALAAAAQRPERIAGLVTLAVPHIKTMAPHFLQPAQLQRSAYMAVLQSRRGPQRLAADDLALVEQLWRAWSPGFVCPADELAAVKAAIRGREQAVAGYYAALRSPRAWFGPSRRLLFALTRVPAMHLHGEDDGCIGVDLCRGSERAYRDAYTLVRVADAGHFLHIERPGIVNSHLLEFIAAVDARQIRRHGA